MTPEPKRATGARYASESEAAAVRRVRGAACTYYDDFARTIIAISISARRAHRRLVVSKIYQYTLSQTKY